MTNVWVGTDLHIYNYKADERHPYRSTSNIERVKQNYAADIDAGDLFIYLGDLCDPGAADIPYLKEMITAIPGYKVMCRGNHDSETDVFYLDLGFDEVCTIARVHSVLLTHKPLDPTELPMDMLNVHGHLHTQKMPGLDYRYINAYDAKHLDHPFLLDDLIEKALKTAPQDKIVTVAKMQDPSQFTCDGEVLDLSDRVQLIPIDETSDDSTFAAQDLNDINTVEDLLAWMRKNIHYANFTRLKTDIQLIKSKSGSCHDQVAFAYPRIRKLGKQCKILFFISYKEGETTGGMTHSLIYWEDDKNVYWFENAWQGMQGIHKYTSLDELKKDIVSKYKRMASAQKFPELDFKTTSITKFKPGITLSELVDSVYGEESANESVDGSAYIPDMDVYTNIELSTIDMEWVVGSATNIRNKLGCYGFNEMSVIVTDQRPVYTDDASPFPSFFGFGDVQLTPTTITLYKYGLDQVNWGKVEYPKLIVSLITFYLVGIMNPEMDPMMRRCVSIWSIPGCRAMLDDAGIKLSIEEKNVFEKLMVLQWNKGPDAYIDLITNGVSLDDLLVEAVVCAEASPLDEILFQDTEDAEYWMNDDNYEPGKRKKEPMADGLGDTINESSFADVKRIVNRIPKEEHHYFYHGTEFKNSPYVVYRDTAYVTKNGKKFGAFIDVYTIDDPGTGVIVIAAEPGARGSGITDTIIQKAIKCAPDDIHTLYWKCDKDNIHSVKLAERNGFSLDKQATDKDQFVYKLERSAVNEAAAETHAMDRDEQNRLAAKYDLHMPGHTEEEQDVYKKKKPDAQQRAEELREQRNKELEKARRTKKRKEFVDKVKSKLPFKAKNEEADGADDQAADYDEPVIEKIPFGERVPFFTDINSLENESIMTTYKFELADKNLRFMTSLSEASSSDDKKLYPVYIMLMHSGTLLANAIKTVTNSKFSHSSISFDSSMRNMYSFGRKSDANPFIGAFKKEDIREEFFQKRQIPYALYVVPCTASEVELMKKRLNYFIQNSTKFKYDFTGLFKNYLGIADNPEYKWFCSRFVADIINAGAPAEHPYVVEPSLMKPEDFRSTNFAIYVTGGMLNTYNQTLVDRLTNKILRVEKIRRAKQAVVLDVNPLDPLQETVLEYHLAMLDESVVDTFLDYLRSFKVKFDKDGNVIITRREYDQLDTHFRHSLKMIKAYENADNLTGVRDELCKIKYMIELISLHYLDPKTKSSDRVRMDLRKQMMDLRSVMLNAFQQHLKYVTVRDPQFNMQQYYNASDYGKDTMIPKSVITSLGKILVTKLG